jgi:hypothetical protein
MRESNGNEKRQADVKTFRKLKNMEKSYKLSL